jgi:hypothetical protein
MYQFTRTEQSVPDSTGVQGSRQNGCSIIISLMSPSRPKNSEVAPKFFETVWNPAWDDHPEYFHFHASQRTAISPEDSSEKHSLFTTVSSLGRNL